jgi:hypothetical protein
MREESSWVARSFLKESMLLLLVLPLWVVLVLMLLLLTSICLVKNKPCIFSRYRGVLWKKTLFLEYKKKL